MIGVRVQSSVMYYMYYIYESPHNGRNARMCVMEFHLHTG